MGESTGEKRDCYLVFENVIFLYLLFQSSFLQIWHFLSYIADIDEQGSDL